MAPTQVGKSSCEPSASSSSSPLRCTECGAAEVADLYACSECFSVFCDSCLLALPKSKVKSSTANGNGDGTAGTAELYPTWSESTSCCSGNGKSGSAIHAPCPTCKRRGEFREVCAVSTVVRRVCQDVVAGAGAASLHCVVCGERAFNNRTCPSCAVVYCSLCLEQWNQQCAINEMAGHDEMSCANCRSIHSLKDFAHDRFAAKLARTWPQQPVPQQASAQSARHPKAQRGRKFKRQNDRGEYLSRDGEVHERGGDAKQGWMPINVPASRKACRELAFSILSSGKAVLGIFSVLVVLSLWLHHKGDVPLETVRHLSDAAMAVDRVGDLKSALEAYLQIRDIRERQNLLETVDGAMLLHNIGVTKGKQGDVHGALEAYTEAWRIRKLTGSLDTADGAHLLYNLGVTLGVLRDVDGAVSAYEEARRIRKATNTLESQEGMDLLRALVFTRSAGGDYDGEVEVYSEMRRVLASQGAAESLDDSMLLHNIGVTKGKYGDVHGALEAYEDALRIRERIGALESHDAAHLLYNMGVTKVVKGDLSGAIAAYEKARDIRETHGSLDSPEGRDLVASLQRARRDLDTHGVTAPRRRNQGTTETVDDAKLLHNIGVTKGKIGDISGSLAAYARARRIRERTGTLETVDGAHLLFNIGVTQAVGGEHGRAVESYEEAWRIHRRTGSLESKHGVQLLQTLAQAKGMVGDEHGEKEVLQALHRIMDGNARDRALLEGFSRFS